MSGLTALDKAAKRRVATRAAWLLLLCLLPRSGCFTSLPGKGLARSRVSRKVQNQKEQWAQLPSVPGLSQTLVNLAPQVSSIVVTSMVLAGVMSAGSTPSTDDWSTNVQVSVTKQQGTSEDGTTWSRTITSSLRETHLGAPLQELSKAVQNLRTTVDQVEVQERLLDELSAAEPSRARSLEQLLWETWYFHENLMARTLVAEGADLMDQGDLEMAKQCFLQAASLEPHWAEAWNRLATVDYLLGNYKYSLIEIDKTLELQPRHFGALSGRGLVYLKLERFQKAVEAFQDAQEVVPLSNSMKQNIAYAESLEKEAMTMR